MPRRVPLSLGPHFGISFNIVIAVVFIFCASNLVRGMKSVYIDSVSPHVLQITQRQIIYANYSGDILLGGMFPVHKLGPSITTPIFDGNYKCGPIDMQDGLQVLEAMFFALKIVNGRKNFLKFRLGALALDTCNDPDYALEQAAQIMQYISYGQKYHPGSSERSLLECSDGSQPSLRGKYREIRNTIGVIGAAMSDVSIALANFLKLFRTPQVSYFSTSPDLSNSLKFPFFLRSVPPDTKAVNAIIDLLKSFQWHYVSVVFDDTNYGSRAYYTFEENIDHEFHVGHKVCIASRMKIDGSESNQDSDVYNRTVNNILKVSRVKVVVLFLTQPHVDKLFAVVNEHPDPRIRHQYLWIGTDSWAGRQELVQKYPLILSRAINIMPRAYINEDFRRYMIRRRPSDKDITNPWLNELFENVCNCSYTNRRTANCSEIEEECAGKVFKDFQPMMYLHFVTDAVLAYAYALKHLQDKQCGNSTVCKMRPEMFTGKKLLDALKNVSFYDLSGEVFQFNGIDGPPNYSVLYFNRTRNTFLVGGQYKGINETGGFGLSSALRLSLTEDFKLHANTFPASKCVDECGSNQSKQFVSISLCCWVCYNCSKNQIVQEDKSTSQSFEGKPSSNCETCKVGNRPNTNSTACEPISEVYMSHSNILAIVVVCVSSCGILFCLFVGVTFIRFCDTPLVKASGRETSFVLLIGIMLSYFLPFVMVSPPSPAVCGISRVAPGLCLTVCYAAILAKTNRIARIFHVQSAKKPKFISPVSQIYICASMITAELIILVIWVILEPPGIRRLMTHQSNVLLCSSDSSPQWSLIGLVFPIVLLTLTTMYAFKVRKTPDGFNEARSLGFVNYANCVVIVTSLPILFLFDELIQSVITVCFLLIMSATAQLLGLFFPKVYIVLLRPEKNTREAVMYRTRSQSQVSISNAVNGMDSGSAVTATSIPNFISGPSNDSNENQTIVETSILTETSTHFEANDNVRVIERSPSKCLNGESHESMNTQLSTTNSTFRPQKSVSFSEMNNMVNSFTDINRQDRLRGSLNSPPCVMRSYIHPRSEVTPM